MTLYSGWGTNSLSDLYWGRTQHVWNNAGDTAYLNNGGGGVVASKTC